MNQETRIKKIQEIVERNKNNPYSYLEIPWNGKLKKCPVYEIPLEYLIFNQHNGRIKMRTKTYETQNHIIQADTREGKEIISKFLYESSDRNKNTEEDLRLYGQKIPGIITKDGVIIDGNRRAMLLNKLTQFSTFKTVVLDDKLEDNPLAIEELETRFQLGEDEKVGYNAIEKYLKVSGLKKEGVSYEKIAEWMNKSVSEIKAIDQVMDMMEEYLDFFSYNGMYTQLDKREDSFISLTKWANNFKGGGSSKGFDGYIDDDIDDLKAIAFDYIRIQFTGEEKSFRKLAEGQSDNHLFGDRVIWKDFGQKHFEFMKLIKDEECLIDKNSSNLEAHLNDRDQKFKESVLAFLSSNLSSHWEMVQNRKSKDKPYELISGAFNKISSIDAKKPIDSQALIQLKEIDKLTRRILGKKSPVILLHDMIDDLNCVNFEVLGDGKLEVLEKIKELHHLTYEIKKNLGS